MPIFVTKVDSAIFVRMFDYVLEWKGEGNSEGWKVIRGWFLKMLAEEMRIGFLM